MHCHEKKYCYRNFPVRDAMDSIYAQNIHNIGRNLHLNIKCSFRTHDCHLDTNKKQVVCKRLKSERLHNFTIPSILFNRMKT